MAGGKEISPEQRRERDKEIALRWLIGDESYSQIARRFGLAPASINSIRHKGEALLPQDQEARLLLHKQLLERGGEENELPYWRGGASEHWEDRRDLIRKARADGATFKEIADELGVSKQAVYALCVRAGIR